MFTLDSNAKYRLGRVCLGCNEPKERGEIVCWLCFKSCSDLDPLKYYTGTVEEWFIYARKARQLTSLKV